MLSLATIFTLFRLGVRYIAVPGGSPSATSDVRHTGPLRAALTFRRLDSTAADSSTTVRSKITFFQTVLARGR